MVVCVTFNHHHDTYQHCHTYHHHYDTYHHYCMINRWSPALMRWTVPSTARCLKNLLTIQKNTLFFIQIALFFNKSHFCYCIFFYKWLCIRMESGDEGARSQGAGQKAGRCLKSSLIFILVFIFIMIIMIILIIMIIILTSSLIILITLPIAELVLASLVILAHSCNP